MNDVTIFKNYVTFFSPRLMKFAPVKNSFFFMKKIHLVSSLELDLHSYGDTRAEAIRSFKSKLKDYLDDTRTPKDKLADLELKVWTRKIPVDS
jgi:hypothetical protein